MVPKWCKNLTHFLGYEYCVTPKLVQLGYRAETEILLNFVTDYWDKATKYCNI